MLFLTGSEYTSLLRIIAWSQIFSFVFPRRLRCWSHFKSSVHSVDAGPTSALQWCSCSFNACLLPEDDAPPRTYICRARLSRRQIIMLSHNFHHSFQTPPKLLPVFHVFFSSLQFASLRDAGLRPSHYCHQCLPFWLPSPSIWLEPKTMEEVTLFINSCLNYSASQVQGVGETWCGGRTLLWRYRRRLP